MLNRIIGIALMFLMFLPGCSVPDGDDMDRLVAAVGGWSQAAKTRVIAYAMNRKALEWAYDRDEHEQIGRTMCYRPDNSLIEIAVWKVGDVIVCLMIDPLHDYRRCTTGMMDEATRLISGEAKEALEQKHGSSLSQCFSELSTRFEPDYQDPLLVDPEAWSDDDIARTVIAMPGPLPGGAFPGFLPVLCPLAEDPDSWGCPETPGGAPGQTPGDGPGGDRP